MANINDIYSSGSDYLKAKDLQKEDGSFLAFQCTIESAEVKDMAKEGEKPQHKVVIELVGRDKAVVLNKTNGVKVASVYGAETSGWIGKEVIITGSLKSFGNDIVPGIDVAPPIVPDNVQAQQVAATAGPTAGDFDEDVPF